MLPCERAHTHTHTQTHTHLRHREDLCRHAHIINDIVIIVQEKGAAAQRPAAVAEATWARVLGGLAHMASLQDHLALALPDGTISLLHAASGSYIR